MTIIFGTTLRPNSGTLTDVAGLMAKGMNVPLRLVHVSEDPRAPVVIGSEEEHVLGGIRDRLALEAERVRASTGAEVHPHLAAGSVVEGLISIAQWELAALIVLGAGPTPLLRPLGSIPERVSRRARLPVLTLRDPVRLDQWLRGKHKLRILVGVDLGLASAEARTFAAQLGSLGDVEVHVALVASPAEVHAKLGLGPPPSEHALGADAESVLLRQLERHAPSEESDATLRVIPARGSADAHLVALSDAENFDLIVIGQRPSTALDQIWYASVAHGVLHASPVSVACVPVALGEQTPVARPPRAILVGTDFSEAGNRAVAFAAVYAMEGGAIHVAHVMDSDLNEADAKLSRDEAWHKLLKVSSANEPRSPTVLNQHLLKGSAPKQLLALAERVDADLIVLGLGSRPALSRSLLGSVARSVAEHSPVPVLLVPGARS